MSAIRWDSSAKLGNVFQYATLLGYCSYKVPENKVILQGFYDWILNFLCCSLGKSSPRRSALPDVSASRYNLILCRILVLRRHMGIKSIVYNLLLHDIPVYVRIKSVFLQE